MQTVSVTKPHNRRQLMAELLAAVPGLQPTIDPETGRLDAGEVSFSSDGDTVRVTMPDSVNPADVQAVLDAHVPAPREPGPDYGTDADDPTKAQVVAVVQDLRAYIALDVTGMTAVQILAATVPVVKTLCRVALLWLRSKFGGGGG